MAAAPIFLVTGETFGDESSSGGTLSEASSRGADGFITGAGFSIHDASAPDPEYSHIIASILVNGGAAVSYRINKAGEAELLNADAIGRDENGNIRIPVKDASLIAWETNPFDDTGEKNTETITVTASVSVMYP